MRVKYQICNEPTVDYPFGGDESGEWIFTAEAPPSQQFGRIHTFGFGNHTIWSSGNGAEGNYVQFESGAMLDSSESTRHIRIEIEDGCISGARIDVNDPSLVVSGRVTGGTEGLSSASSNILFAIGENLVHTEPIDGGQFSISVPVGYALPRSGELLEVGVAASFNGLRMGPPKLQWYTSALCQYQEDIA